MHEKLAKTCSGDHQHSGDYDLLKTGFYPPALARQAANVIMEAPSWQCLVEEAQAENDNGTEEAFPVTEVPRRNRPRPEGSLEPDQCERLLRRLHQNLGHPHNEVLVRMLRSGVGALFNVRRSVEGGMEIITSIAYLPQKTNIVDPGTFRVVVNVACFVVSHAALLMFAVLCVVGGVSHVNKRPIGLKMV